MGVMIIGPDDTTEVSDVPKSSNKEKNNRQIIETPELEERGSLVEDEIRRRQENEQAIIARIIGNPLA
jgi:hypothetical protein